MKARQPGLSTSMTPSAEASQLNWPNPSTSPRNRSSLSRSAAIAVASSRSAAMPPVVSWTVQKMPATDPSSPRTGR